MSTAMMPAVLWLHGLGDTGAGWEGAFGALAQKATFHHPDAPIQAVSVQGGAKMTSWFDINTWPISLQEPEGPAGIEATVKAVQYANTSLRRQTRCYFGPARSLSLGYPYPRAR